MKKESVFGLLLALVLLACAPFFSQNAEANAQSRVRINGTVVGIGGRLGGRTWPFSLIIERVTTAAEVEQLEAALRKGGNEELLEELSDMSAGRIQIGNNVGLPANAIVISPREGGRSHIKVFYERNLSFYERRYGTRSEDYRIGYAELFLDRNGRGEGTFIPAARVRLRNGNVWEVEDFGIYPARIMGLHASGQLPR